MYKPQGLINLQGYIVPCQPFIPKSTKTLFLLIYFCLGFDFGFGKTLHKNIQPLAKFISLVSPLVAIATTVTSLLLPGSMYSKVKKLQIIAFHLFLMFYTYIAKPDMYAFLESISNVTSTKSFGELPGLLAILYVISIFFLQNYIYYFHTPKAALPEPSYLYHPVSLIMYESYLEFLTMILLIVVYSLYCRVKQVNNLVNNSKLTFYKLQKYYLDVADSYDKVKMLYDILITILLLYHYSGISWTLYTILGLTDTNRSAHIVNPIFYLLYHVLAIAAPSIVKEMLTSETEKLKRILSYHLVIEEDPRKGHRIQQLLNYMESRHLEHKAFRLIPLGVDLMVITVQIWLGFCITVQQFALE